MSNAQIAALTAWHKAQLGTKESPPGSNNVRYNTLYYGREINSSAYAWCMVYIWAGFKECGLSHLFFDGGKTASCTTLMKWAANNGLFISSGYREGDIMLYDWDGDPSSEHTGYVIAARSDTDLDVIEGNAGDAVKQTHPKPSTIIGAFRPAYDGVQPNPQKPTEAPERQLQPVQLPILREGMVGKDVLAMQQLLLSYRYKLPKYGADAEFGEETRAALMQYQRDNGLVVDGECGAATYTKLLR